jgi:hypothetical protein
MEMSKEELKTAYLKVSQEKELLLIILTHTIMNLSSAIERLPEEINFPIRVTLEAVTRLDPDS